MRFDAPLQPVGELRDFAAGRRSYQSYVEWQAGEGLRADLSLALPNRLKLTAQRRMLTADR